MIKSYTYSAESAGPRLVIFGAVHGNEVCGPIAIRRVMDELDSGQLNLARGQLHFVPIANPRAHAEGKRFIERNLNRYFLPDENPTTYEARLTNILCSIIGNTDYFIDIHSTTAGGVTFASVSGDVPEENRLAAAMGAEIMVYGWQKAYLASGRPEPDPKESSGTTAYARSRGAKGVLLECGQHQDPKSIEVAYQAIRRALRTIGLVDAGGETQAAQPTVIRVASVVFRGEGGELAENWTNFAQVKAGQKLAQMSDGSVINAPADRYMILPNPNAPKNAEWFYLGEKV